MIKILDKKKGTATNLLKSECCEFMVSHSGTGFTAKPIAHCRKRAVIDFYGKKVCQQHAGQLSLEKLIKEQSI